MRKFPFRGRGFVAVRDPVPYAGRARRPMQAAGAHSLCQSPAPLATPAPSASCASRSSACPWAPAKRCWTGCSAASASSSAPTPTARAECVRCSPPTAAAGAPTSSPSRAPGIASRTHVAVAPPPRTSSLRSSHCCAAACWTRSAWISRRRSTSTPRCAPAMSARIGQRARADAMRALEPARRNRRAAAARPALVGPSARARASLKRKPGRLRALAASIRDGSGPA